ncbi:MAG: heparinase II/III family protein [Chthoniobacteraceae bacterium]|nr:heparinase II/III family protein [Chthoniobacteraceae bacterium]
MTPHPRLLASPFQLERLKEPPESSMLRRASRLVAAEASGFVKNRELLYGRNLHNALLVRAREMQHRVLTLVVRWKQTGQERFRRAAIEDVRSMGAWEYWSWDMDRTQNPDPNADFDLSYGENSATLALAYDWLHASLNAEERVLFLEIASRWSFGPFLARTEGERKAAWWFGVPHSNWNTVCAGGAGMLALAMLDDLPEAAEVLRRADLSVTPYLESLDATGGGWIEGIGYWNYGHRYAFWYLLSYERAMGKEHPLLRLPGVARTLDFPLDFCPHGQPCSFGDVNTWSAMAFHYAAAARLGRADLVEKLDALSVAKGPPASEGSWPNAAELLVFHPRCAEAAASSPERVCKLYPEMDWGILADQRTAPGLYLSVRGGAGGWNVPHGHLDLLSFHCVAGGERLIVNHGINGGDEYLDTTFSNRRFELFETTPASNNTRLVNGVGMENPSRVTTTRMEGEGWSGFRMDATEAIRFEYMERPSTRFCGRLFLLLEGPCAVVLDQVELFSPGRVETRLHTFARVRFGREAAEILGRRERLQLAFASTVPSALFRAEDALTTPGPRSTVLRWCTRGRTHTRMTMATLLVPGGLPAKISLEEGEGFVLVRAEHGGRSDTLRISTDLREVRAV